MKVKNSPSKPEPLITWDESDIVDAEVERRMEEDNPDKLSESEIRDQVYQDSVLFDMEYECMCDSLTELMTDIQTKGNNGYDWKAEVMNFGWDNRSGWKEFHAENGQKLLEEVLPRTQCTFKIFVKDREIQIQNFHHDSPTGNEWYSIKPKEE